MTPASEETVPNRLARGRSELKAGRWQAARQLFESVTSEVESAEAYEGLSWAAWWVDDAEVVFSARERAFRLYKDADDVLGAARMATWLGCDELDFHGAVNVAGGWFGRARRLLDPVEAAPEHGWLSFFEGYLARATGDASRSLELASEASELGLRLKAPDLEMLGLALEGSNLVARAQVDEGMRRLDEATAAALEGEAEIPISGAWACCMLVGACAAVRDYDRAAEWCDRIETFADRYGSRYMLAFCRAEYGAVDMWRGDWSKAETMLEAAVDDFRRSRPAMAGAPLVGLAELRRRQGRDEEALELLERGGPDTATQLCRARIALDQGDAERAAETAARALRQVPEDSMLDRAPALELLIAARIACGELDEAAAALDQLRELERSVRTAPLRASADLAEGTLVAARGDHEGARILLEDAVDGFERTHGPFEAALARIELARCLAALGRTASAQEEAEAAHRRLVELGAGSEAEASRRLLHPQADDSPLPELTPRERDVLALLAEGLTNRVIAERLVVSEHTVHRHVTNILRKLDLPSRAAAAAHAARAGLTPSPHQ